MFGTDIKSEEEMERWFKTQRPSYDHEPRNGEEMSLSRVGKELYERVIKFFLHSFFHLIFTKQYLTIFIDMTLYLMKNNSLDF